MPVYLVKDITYSEESTYGIFSSKEMANEAVRRLNKLWFFRSRSLNIEERQLDSFDTGEEFERDFREEGEA